MSLFEALIIYLSAGAPFGVLVFFSQRTPPRTAVLYSLIATVAWPIVAAQRVFRSFSIREDRTPTETSLLEVLHGLADEVPGETAELFEIAGHPNPWLATNCYVRSRKKVVRSHIDRLEATTPAVMEEIEIARIPEYSTAAMGS